MRPLILAGLLGLAACSVNTALPVTGAVPAATPTASQAAKTLATVQASVVDQYGRIVPIVDAACASGELDAATVAKIKAAEDEAAKLLPAFAQAVVPDNVTSLLKDAQIMVSALPAGQTATEAQELLTAAQIGWQAYQLAKAVRS